MTEWHLHPAAASQQWCLGEETIAWHSKAECLDVTVRCPAAEWHVDLVQQSFCWSFRGTQWKCSHSSKLCGLHSRQFLKGVSGQMREASWISLLLVVALSDLSPIPSATQSIVPWPAYPLCICRPSVPEFCWGAPSKTDQSHRSYIHLRDCTLAAVEWCSIPIPLQLQTACSKICQKSCAS